MEILLLSKLSGYFHPPTVVLQLFLDFSHRQQLEDRNLVILGRLSSTALSVPVHRRVTDSLITTALLRSCFLCVCGVIGPKLGKRMHGSAERFLSGSSVLLRSSSVDSAAAFGGPSPPSATCFAADPPGQTKRFKDLIRLSRCVRFNVETGDFPSCGSRVVNYCQQGPPVRPRVQISFSDLLPGCLFV